jgi:tetratricopeptide (TPR) repeat protein
MSLDLTPMLNQAYKAFQSGQLDIAQSLTVKVLNIQSSNFDALYLSGVINGIKGLHDISAKQFKKAVAQAPQHPFAHFNLAKALMELGKYKDALNYLEKSLKIEPSNPEAEMNLGLCLMKLDAFAKALKHFEAAIQLKVNNTDAIICEAICNLELGYSDKAIEKATLASQIRPECHTAWSTLGTINHKIKNYDEAILNYKKALDIDSENFTHHQNLGKCFMESGRLNESIKSYELAHKLKPSDTDCLNSLAYIYMQSGDYQNAKALLERALKINSNDYHSHLNLSIMYFLQFNFEMAWKEYEWRDLNKFLIGGPFASNKRVWKYQDTNDHVLIWGEQGVGDQIIYSSMLSDVSRIAKRLQIGIDDRLINLVKRSHPELDLISIKERPINSQFDSYLPIASLGQYFRKELTDFPVPQPFLKAAQEKIDFFKSKMPENKLICGVAWKSKNNLFCDSKSIRANQLVSLLGLSEIHFINLQYSPDPEDLEVFSHHQSPVHSLENLDTFNDLDGLAAAIMACDLVITISNTTAHLSGALGKETLLLLPHAVGKYWYWNEYQGRNLWYPNIKVFQQKIEGDWSHPLAELQKYLEQKIA